MANVKTQAARFGRLFGAALVTQAAALDFNHLGRSVIISAVIGAAEVAWRQYKPATPAAKAPDIEHPAGPNGHVITREEGA